MALLGRLIRDVLGRGEAAAEPAAIDAADGEPLRIFIEREPRAPTQFHTLSESLLYRASVPLSITALTPGRLPIGREEPRPLEFGRLLVPWLCGYRGWALFLESDMLALDDVAGLFEYADDRYAVMQARSVEPGEWNSLLLFNCAHPANRMLTPEFLGAPDSLQSADLLFWLDEELVGVLPPEWNQTVAYDLPSSAAKMAHFPLGIPWHVETQGCEYSEAWWEAHRRAGTSCSWVEMYGHSYHAATAQNGRLVPFAMTSAESGVGRLLDAPAELPPPPGPPPLGPRSLRVMERAAGAMREAGAVVDGLAEHRDRLALLCARTSAGTLLDYGAGAVESDSAGTAALASAWHLRELCRFDPCWPASSTRPQSVFDGVACIHVLDQVPEEDVDAVLRDVFGHAMRFVLLVVRSVREPVAAEGVDGVHPHTPFWWRHRVQDARRASPGALFMVVCEIDGADAVVIEG